MFTETESVDEKAQQTSLILSQIPKPPCRNRLDGNSTVDIRNNYDTALPVNDFSVGVRIERTIIRDAKPLDEESETTATKRDLYSSPISVQVWDEAKGFKA